MVSYCLVLVMNLVSVLCGNDMLNDSGMLFCVIVIGNVL